MSKTQPQPAHRTDQARESMNIVVVGHVDHGKSTLIGRMLYDTAALPEGAIEKVKRICKEKGKLFEYAFLLDAFEEEQKQGITIDTTQIQFFTDKRDYIIIDAPGHKEFLKNMVSGAANAEAALLVVDAQEGIQEQSKRHGYILSLLGIQKVYVIVNKMDLVDYSAEKFREIKEEFQRFLNSLNVFPNKYIPVSAFAGDNITSRSPKMSWYEGEPVLTALDYFVKDKELTAKPLRLPIQDIYKFDQRRIIAGRIESGVLKAGDRILISPGEKVTTVKSIEYWAERDKREAAGAGVSVGITVTDEFFNDRGEIISHLTERPTVGRHFKANLFWMGKQDLVKNKRYKLKLTTAETECEISSIVKVIDAASLKSAENPSAVKTNDVAEVIIKTKEPICFDRFTDNRTTGRFVLVDGYDVTGGGIIVQLQTGSTGEPSYSHQSPYLQSGPDPLAVPQSQKVTRLEREKRAGQRGRVVWLSGPPDQQLAWAERLERELFEKGKLVYHLDGAFLQEALTGNVEPPDPAVNTGRIAEVAKHLLDNGLITIVTSDTGKKDFRQARNIIGEADIIEVKLTRKSKLQAITDMILAAQYPDYVI